MIAPHVVTGDQQHDGRKTQQADEEQEALQFSFASDFFFSHHLAASFFSK
jgi:hypothetical protein